LGSLLVRLSRHAGLGIMLAVMKLAVPIIVPPRALRGATNAGIEAVARIKVLVVIDQFRFCVVQMAEVVLGWELRATRVQQSPHLVFQLEGVVAFSHNVVLMEDMTEKSARNTVCAKSDSLFHPVRFRTSLDHCV
jgi:hypothetical protein